MQMMRLNMIAVLGALALSPVAAMAQGTGSEGYFAIHNDTGSNVLIGFYSDDGSGWSESWLNEPIMPGTAADVEFIADTGSCAQSLRAGWLGADGESEVLDEPFDIDICDASNVYLGDNDITYD